MKNKNITRPLIATLFILAIPFLGNIFVDGWNWEVFDFIFMGALIFGTGLLVVEFVNMKIKNKNYRILIIFLIILALIIAWVHLAVGIVDTWPMAGS